MLAIKYRGEFPEVLDAIIGETAGPAGWYRVPCPFCASRGHTSKKRKLSVHAESGYFHCWRPSCGVSGFVNLGTYRKKVEKDETDDGTRALPAEFIPLGYERPTSLSLQKYWDYLVEKRGLMPQAIVEAGLGACNLGRYANSVVIPVTTGGVVVGFTTRSVVGKRFDNPPGFQRTKFLLNGDALLEETTEPAIIVEGPFDCMRHWPHAVSCLGKPAKQHTQILAAARRPLIICLDADAQSEGWSVAATLLVMGKSVKVQKIPPGTDPGKWEHDVFMTWALQARSPLDIHPDYSPDPVRANAVQKNKATS